jgi:TusA-related sulfurtransferase
VAARRLLAAADKGGWTMATQVDARGLSCPQPVVLTKKAMDSITSGEIEVLVDNPAARENVARFARNAGCSVEIGEERDGSYVISISKAGRKS